MSIKTFHGATSKGNQPKFFEDGYLYKIDSMGYESISEALVSEFLHFVEDVEFIDYYLEKKVYHGRIVECCCSKVYNKEDESFVSIYKILDKGERLRGLKRVSGVEAVDYIVSSVMDLTRLDIREYLALLSVLDSIILNEDRHLNNISLIESPEGYRLAPVFDNGLSLLSDTTDYPLYDNTLRLMNKVKCKPFNVSFKKQLNYFVYKPLVVDYKGFLDKIDLVKGNLDLYVPFKKNEFLRACDVLLKRLKDSEGYLWVRK